MVVAMQDHNKIVLDFWDAILFPSSPCPVSDLEIFADGQSYYCPVPPGRILKPKTFQVVLIKVENMFSCQIVMFFPCTKNIPLLILQIHAHLNNMVTTNRVE